MKIINAAPVNYSFSSMSSKTSDSIYKYFGDFICYEDLQILWIYKTTRILINNKVRGVTSWDPHHMQHYQELGRQNLNTQILKKEMPWWLLSLNHCRFCQTAICFFFFSLKSGWDHWFFENVLPKVGDTHLWKDLKSNDKYCQACWRSSRAMQQWKHCSQPNKVLTRSFPFWKQPN